MTVDSVRFLEERIGKDNPFTSIYFETENNIERVLNLGSLGEFQPPKFGEAVKLYLTQTFDLPVRGTVHLAKLAGSDPTNSSVAHVVNGSGREDYRGEKGRPPRLDFQTFFRASNRPDEKQITRLGEDYRRFSGRIPGLFYERETG
ncbi:MAG: hypothetical protein AABY10_05440 [Nanoarchaeota archaeon]